MTRNDSVAILGTRGFPSYYGGFETLVRRLAPYLAERGWQVDVYGRAGSTLEASPLVPGVQPIYTPGLNSSSLSTLSYGLTSSLHATVRKPSVALVMNVANGYWLPFLKARHIPTVVNVDGIEWQRDKWGRYARNVFRGGAKVTARFADTLIYDSRVIAQVWEREFKRSGEFIPYGGDQIGGIPPPDGLSSRQYVLFVARLVPENSAREFFAAASDLCQNFDIVVVGSSGYKNEFDHLAAQLAEEHERVRWYGHINDDRVLNALWYNAGVYFHGHTAGGTNPSLVQAMACGAPILAVDTRFNREVLGDHGTFVQPEPHSIVASISRLMRNCKWQEETAEYAKERAASGYSWNTVCSDYERVLHTTAETQS